MKMFRKDEGFTLVELMVVVLIIGILVAIAVPIFNAAKGSAQQKTCFANERTVEGAYQSYLASSPTAAKATNWDDLKGELIPDYVKEEPKCPAGGDYTATPGNGGDSVTVSCSIHQNYADQ